jgi:hypothetical protein
VLRNPPWGMASYYRLHRNLQDRKYAHHIQLLGLLMDLSMGHNHMQIHLLDYRNNHLHKSIALAQPTDH